MAKTSARLGVADAIEEILRRQRSTTGLEQRGWLGVIPNITGLLSGRIRTDTFGNFASDLMGIPSEQDRLEAFETEQRRLSPNWKPGDPIKS